MPAKKVKPRPRPIEYLLSLDRKLQKLSLRRISRPAKSRPRAPRVKAPWGQQAARWQQAVAFGVVGVIVAAVMITARQPSPPVDVASVADDVALPARTDASVPRAPRATASPSPVEAQPAPTAPRTVVSTPKPPAASPTPKVATATPSATTTTRSAATATPSAATAAPSAATAAPSATTAAATADPPVTISGCLQRDADGFQLTDVSGADAPRVRSWKSGFLRKRSSSVELVTERSAVGLASYVGQRVSATGTLEDRNLHVRSIRATGPCD